MSKVPGGGTDRDRETVVRRNPAAVITCIFLLVAALAFVGYLIVDHLRGDPEDELSTVLRRSDFDGDPLDYISPPADLKSVVLRKSELEALFDRLKAEILEQSTEYTDASEGETAAAGDRLTIAYSGRPIDLESADRDQLAALEVGNLSLVLGEDELFPAHKSEDPDRSTASLDDGLVGILPGETRTLTVTLPERFSSDEALAELVGGRIELSVTLSRLEKARVPDFDDALVTRYTGGEQTSVDALRESVYESNRPYLAYDALCKAITVNSYPGEMIDRAVASYIEGLLPTLFGDNLPTDDQLKEVTDQYYDEAYDYAKESVADRLRLEYLLGLTGITLTEGEYRSCLDEDYRSESMTYLTSFGIGSASELEDTFGKDYLVVKYSYFKLLDIVCDLITLE